MTKHKFGFCSLGFVICLVIGIWSLGFLAGGCGHGVPEGGTTPDTTPPTITLVYPANGATSVATTAAVTATFSKAMDTSTLNTTTFTLVSSLGASVTGVVTYDAPTKTALLRPSSPLTFARTYIATVAATVKDTTGNAMGTPYSWSFTTAASADSTGPTFAGLTSLEVNSTSKATLTWSPATDNITPQNRIIYQIFQGGSAAAVLAMTTPTYTTMDATSYQVTGLTQTTLYYFLVRAVDESGNKDSNIVTQHGLMFTLSTPRSIRPLSCSVMSGGSTLGWTSITYADGYQVQLSTSRTFSPVSETGSPTTNSYAPTSTGAAPFFWRVRAKEESNYSGWSQTWEITLGKAAGDVNGDGYADVIVGAYGAEGGGTDKGQAYIYYGGITGSKITQEANVIITGEADSDRLGISVDLAGDVNKDGYTDIIVGADQANGLRGKAYLYFGGPSLPKFLTPAQADVTFSGNAAKDFLGYSVSSAGDVNGDGYADVIVGAYGYNGGTAKGRAYIYYGGPSMDGNPNITLTGENDADRFGDTVAAAGDVNGDGYADVIVSARKWALGTDQGKAYIFFGGATPDSTPEVTVIGQNNGDNLRAVCTAGDMNGDGYADVIMGAYGADGGGADKGQAYIFLGSSTFSGDKSTTSADLTISGGANDDYLGCAVSTAGDTNKDNYSDILVGASGANGGGTDKGQAYVFLGSSNPSGSKAITDAYATITGQADFDALGVSVSSVADFNLDTYPDIILGAIGVDSNKGKAYLFIGGSSLSGPKAVTDALVTISGGNNNDYLGCSVSGAKQ
jgi:hypothetical protein